MSTALTARHPEPDGTEQAPEDDGGGDGSGINFELMWTWFLPNPLWKPKQR